MNRSIELFIEKIKAYAINKTNHRMWSVKKGYKFIRQKRF